MSIIYSDLGKAVRTRRKLLGLTLEELSEASNLHASYIGQIERNSKKASLETMGALAKALGVPLSDLFSVVSKKPEYLFSEQLGAIMNKATSGEKKFILHVIRQLVKGLRTLKEPPRKQN